MTTSEESIEEETKDGDDSQNDDFISLSRFELLEWFIKRALSPPPAKILLSNNVDVALDLAWEGELLKM